MSWLLPTALALAVGGGLASLWRPPVKPGDLVVVSGSRLRTPTGQPLGLTPETASSRVVVRVTAVTAGPRLFGDKHIAGNPAGFVDANGTVRALPPLALPVELVHFDRSDIAGTADANGIVRT